MMRKQTEDVRFRKIACTDAPFIHALMACEEYREIFCKTQTTEKMWEERIADLLASRGKHNFIILCGDTGAAIGWIMFEMVSQDTCKLHLLAFKPDMIGHSYGRMALAHMTGKLSGRVRQLTADVQRANSRAVRFYRKNGFYVVAEEMQQTGDGIKPYYIMRCELPSKTD